jgi:putative ABC transport system ATP-binding protein
MPIGRQEAEMAVLQTSALTKTYQLGEHIVQALGGVDFVVEKGEFVAIMGPSGSGKSTLLHLLGGLDRPSSGEVMLAGRQLSLLNDRQTTLIRRQQVGFVFQFFNLLPHLTARENILLPVVIDGKNPRAYAERLQTLLALVDLADRQNHKPDQLSGGEQQRVAIARALITDPAIVLADEPTGNLDSKSGTMVMELLRRSCRQLGQTVVVVTHDPRAASFADRAVFLRDGLVDIDRRFDPDSDQPARLRLVMDTLAGMED